MCVKYMGVFLLTEFPTWPFFNDNIDKEFKFRGYLHACHGINITVIGFEKYQWVTHGKVMASNKLVIEASKVVVL